MKYLLIRRKTIYFICSSIMLIALASTGICFAYGYNNNYTYSKNQSDKIITQEVKQNVENIYKNKNKIAYLTFDDGPTKKVTPKVLEILDKLDVKASFFVVGKHVEESPELVKTEYEAGHYIANHGFSHNDNKMYKSKESFIEEVQNTDKAIAKAIGVENYSAHLFRFPKGSTSRQNYLEKKNCKKYLEEIDYTYIDWNALNNDSVRKYTNQQLMNNLKRSVKGKDTIVVLMHDTGDVNNTYDILEDSINYLKEEGYKFRTFYDIT